jgi:hypothetical protein
MRSSQQVVKVKKKIGACQKKNNLKGGRREELEDKEKRKKRIQGKR